MPRVSLDGREDLNGSGLIDATDLPSLLTRGQLLVINQGTYSAFPKPLAVVAQGAGGGGAIIAGSKDEIVLEKLSDLDDITNIYEYHSRAAPYCSFTYKKKMYRSAEAGVCNKLWELKLARRAKKDSVTGVTIVLGADGSITSVNFTTSNSSM